MLGVNVQIFLKEGDKFGIWQVFLVVVDEIARILFMVQACHIDLKWPALVISTLLHIDFILYAILFNHEIIKLVCEYRGLSAPRLLPLVAMSGD